MNNQMKDVQRPVIICGSNGSQWITQMDRINCSYVYKCPSCYSIVPHRVMSCPYCKQKLDWSLV